jgi:hypothetical protein
MAVSWQSIYAEYARIRSVCQYNNDMTDMSAGFEKLRMQGEHGEKCINSRPRASEAQPGVGNRNKTEP